MALKTIEQYKYENNIEVSTGDLFEYSTVHLSGSKKPNLTVGNTYTVENVKQNYNLLKIAVAIRDDNNILRWYSYRFIKRDWIKK